MINNAGICQIKPMLDVTQEELETIYRINLFGMVYGVQAAAKKMIKLGKKTGHIVSASSIAGFEGFPILSAYSSTKFAVRGFTQAAAQELAPYNITVNGYAPGIVDTPMWTFIDEEMSKLNGKPLGQNFKDMVDTLSLIHIFCERHVGEPRQSEFACRLANLHARPLRQCQLTAPITADPAA